MIKLQRILIVLIAIGPSCAVLDGYKDNQHSQYSKELTPQEKNLIDQGQVLTKVIDTPAKKGKLIIMQGDPKIGEYNFVEVGDWKEYYEFSSGDFIRGERFDEITYDEYGNILKRKVIDKKKGETEFYPNQVWTSRVQVFDSDTVLTQKITWLNKNEKVVAELNLAVLDYKKLLSDRLKTKIKIGTEKAFDDSGNLQKEKTYRFQDKIKFR